jgi:hypothetical protein
MDFKGTARPRKEVLKTADAARGYVLGECGGQASPLDSSRGEPGHIKKWHERTVPEQQSHYTRWLRVVNRNISSLFSVG